MPGTVLVPGWHTVEWGGLLGSCLVISIFIAGHIHYVSRVLALLFYKHTYTAIRDCFHMRKLSLRQTKSHFFFSRSDSYQCCWTQSASWKHSVAKGTERSEFRVEKVLLQGHAGERLFIGKIGRGTAGCVTLLWFIGGCVPGVSMISFLVPTSLESRSFC